MQTQTFETSKGTLMAIRMEYDDKVLPDRIEGVYRSTSVYGEKIGRQKVFYFPKGFKEIGLWGSVSEEKAMEVGLENLESLQSLLETGIKLSNPLGERFNADLPAFPDSSDYEEVDQRRDEWQTAEAEVWRHFYLIFKTK